MGALRSFGAQIRYMAVPSGPWLALVALRAPVLSLCAPLSLVSSTLVRSACPPLSLLLGARRQAWGQGQPKAVLAAKPAKRQKSLNFPECGIFSLFSIVKGSSFGEGKKLVLRKAFSAKFPIFCEKWKKRDASIHFLVYICDFAATMCRYT